MVYTEEVANGVIKFTWEPSFQSQKVKSVEVILAQARGVNHDPFESFVEGTSQKDDSTLQIHKLNPCTSGHFEKSIELPLETYQFLFRVTDEENQHRMTVSGSHLQTVLASGTTVNYVEKNTPSRIRDGMQSCHPHKTCTNFPPNGNQPPSLRCTPN